MGCFLAGEARPGSREAGRFLLDEGVWKWAQVQCRRREPLEERRDGLVESHRFYVTPI